MTCALIERAQRLTGEPGIVVPAGLRLRLAGHGILGFALMTASTIGELLVLVHRFGMTRTQAFKATLELPRVESGDEATLTLRERVPLGAFLEPITIMSFCSIASVGQEVLEPSRLKDLRGELEFAFSLPSYAIDLPRLSWPPELPLENFQLRFDRPETRLTLPRDVLDLPVRTADAAATRFAQEQCEQMLARLDRQGRLAEMVADLARRRGGGYRTLTEVARDLAVTPRTLERRLATSGTTYRALVDDLRRTQAEELLERPDLSIEEISQRLGYTEAANFGRAFKRWTGVSPGAWRRAR